jgi:hypothetical protein
MATFHHGFTRVEDIRELSVGRVIVLDRSDGTVYMMDSEWAGMTQIGRRGEGPGEYRGPVDLFALPNDSSAVYDNMTSRLLIIEPDGTSGGFLHPMGAAGEPMRRSSSLRSSSKGIMLLPATATDGRGYFYCLAQPVVVGPDGKLEVADSSAIERWTAISAMRDTVGYLRRKLPSTASVRPAIGMVTFPVPKTQQAFRGQDQWAVGPDGRVAIVTYEPYQVKFIDALLNVVVGPPIQYDPIRVTEAHKEQWRENQQRRRPALVVTKDGGSGMVPMTPKPVEPEWPKYLPPFVYPQELFPYEAVYFAPDGMLWVMRTTPADEPPTFDMIDKTGRVVRQVKLPHSTRLAGFGNGTLYLVRIDEVDLEYLEKYELPRTGGL